MKIQIVLTSCNLNSYYYNLYPYVYKVWKEKFDLDLYLILISDYIPENLKKFEQFIILFTPIPNINSAYISQVIRILYPSLFNNLNVLITDIDIIPISKNYFFNSIEQYSDTQFITYTDRYIANSMYAICYNVANSKIWKNIFNINSIQDIIIFLTNNYDYNYNGLKNCSGWYSDQKILFKYLEIYRQNNLNDVIILSDDKLKYNRLDGKSAEKLNFILKNKKNILENINIYSDFHMLRSYDKNLKLLEDIINSILL